MQRQRQRHATQRATFARDVPVSLLFGLLAMIKCSICSYQCDPPRRLASPRHATPRHATPMPMATPSPSPSPTPRLRPRPKQRPCQRQRQRQRHATPRRHATQRVAFARYIPASLLPGLLAMIKCSICSYHCAPPRHATARRHAGNGTANANANADADADTALYHFPFNSIRFRTLLLMYSL